jgi:hypothetical protein
MAQPEDGSIREAETCCCYKWFKYLLIVITWLKVVLDCKIIYIYFFLLIIEHNEDVSPENSIGVYQGYSLLNLSLKVT